MPETVSPSLPAHGGNLAWAEASFGTPAEGWLDLSTGINPNPYPDLACSPDIFAALPSEAALDRLLQAARKAYDVPVNAGICAASGTQALIQILPLLHGAERIAVVSPTYSEHAGVWRSAGRDVVAADHPEAASNAAVVVVTNPNNPDGRHFDRPTLEALQDRLAERGGLLVVDEAFADTAPRISLAPAADRPGAIVLRSFGKFFGLAGLRLGFAVGPPALIRRIEALLGPWAVSGPALEIGARALADSDWIEKTRGDLADRRTRLDRMLAAAGFRILGGTDLFRLTDHQNAASVYRSLGQAGILVRAYADRPTWLRFGLPGEDAAFDRLERALASR